MEVGKLNPPDGGIFLYNQGFHSNLCLVFLIGRTCLFWFYFRQDLQEPLCLAARSIGWIRSISSIGSEAVN
jgi:hypothetical protein